VGAELAREAFGGLESVIASKSVDALLEIIASTP